MTRLLAVLALVATLAVACRSGSSEGDGGLYAVVGASDAKGFGADNPVQESWPQVLLHRDLPAGSGLMNVAVPGSTVAEALKRQAPDAAAADAKATFVWLSVDDLLHSVPPATYESQLRQLVHILRRGGHTRVLVGNTPPLDRLPAYQACRSSPSTCRYGQLPPPEVVDAAVQAYNAAIARVVRAEGAELVDLNAVAVRARQAGTDASLVSSDGFHPSTAGHKAIADAFAQVFSRK